MKPVVLACLLVVAGLAAGCTGKPAERQPIACADSPLAVPFHMAMQCYRLPFDNGGFPTCQIDSFLATGSDRERQFVAMSFATAASGRTRCVVTTAGNVALELHGASGGGSPGSRFGDVMPLRDGFAMTFSRVIAGTWRNCFSFVKFGPRRRDGYDSVVKGFLCNLNATIPDQTAMQAVIDGVGVPC